MEQEIIMNQSKNICFVAGRSGGHIMPALTLADEYKKNHSTSRVLFFSTDTELETAIIRGNRTIDLYYPLIVCNTPNRFYKMPIFAWHMIRAWATSIRILRAQKPESVVSTGGYIALPVCIAAWMLRIPISLWELNAVPGRATKLLAPFARTIHVCFAECARFFSPKKVVISPYPIRFANAPRSASQAPSLRMATADRRIQLGLAPDKKTVLVLGGSQGSVYLNNLIKKWVIACPPQAQETQIIHQTGATDTTNWSEFYHQQGIQALVCAFSDDIETYYAASDLVICRAGAGSLFETAFFKKKAIVIPLEAQTTDHQVDNAYAIAQQYPHLFTVLRQQDIDKNPALFYDRLSLDTSS